LEEIAVVTKKLENGMIELEVQRNSACGDCKACSNSLESKKHILIIKDSVGVDIGDRVLLNTEGKNFLKNTLIVYAIPFAFLIIGMVLGYFVSTIYSIFDPDLISFIVGILFLSISYLLLRFLDKKYFKNNTNVTIIGKKM